MDTLSIVLKKGQNYVFAASTEHPCCMLSIYPGIWKEILVVCGKEGVEDREKKEGRKGSKILLILIFAMVC